jgi:hypothetical protein
MVKHDTCSFQRPGENRQYAKTVYDNIQKFKQNTSKIELKTSIVLSRLVLCAVCYEVCAMRYVLCAMRCWRGT